MLRFLFFNFFKNKLKLKQVQKTFCCFICHVQLCLGKLVSANASTDASQGE